MTSHVSLSSNRAAALATGCEVKIDQAEGTFDLRQNKGLGRSHLRNDVIKNSNDVLPKVAKSQILSPASMELSTMKNGVLKVLPLIL